MFLDAERAELAPKTLAIMSKATPRESAVAAIREAFLRAGLLEGGA